MLGKMEKRSLFDDNDNDDHDDEDDGDCFPHLTLL